jgi:hypothetical protein
MLDALVGHANSVRFDSWILNLVSVNYGETALVLVLRNALRLN